MDAPHLALSRRTRVLKKHEGTGLQGESSAGSEDRSIGADEAFGQARVENADPPAIRLFGEAEIDRVG
jgi:hypothetical protein